MVAAIIASVELVGMRLPQLTDSDGDGLVDLREVSMGTDPTRIDTDMDGLSDGLEVELRSNPLLPSPAMVSILSLGMDPALYRSGLSVMDLDGRLSPEEAEFLRALARAISMISNSSVYPYLTDEMRGEAVRSVISAATRDGRISGSEARALAALKDLPPDVRLAAYAFGLPSDENLPLDWDLDGASNLEEVLSGSNPFTDLEGPDSENRSDLYLIAIQGRGPPASNIFLIYHMAALWGLRPENSRIIISRNSTSTAGVDSTWILWQQISRPEVGPFRVGEYTTSEVYGRRFGADSLGPVPVWQYLEDLEGDPLRDVDVTPDANDRILIVLDGHHAPGSGCLSLSGRISVSPREVSEFLSRLRFGIAYVIINACQGSDLLDEFPPTSGGRVVVVTTSSIGQLVDGEYTRIFESLSLSPFSPNYYSSVTSRAPWTLIGALEFFSSTFGSDSGIEITPSWRLLGSADPEDLLGNPMAWSPAGWVWASDG